MPGQAGSIDGHIVVIANVIRLAKVARARLTSKTVASSISGNCLSVGGRGGPDRDCKGERGGCRRVGCWVCEQAKE